ncbi:MAG: MltR family transcriptional regulator [Acidiferrobacterales bacterium]
MTPSAKYDWLHDYNQIVRICKDESDRAAALLAASFLEHVISEKLKSFFVAEKSIGKLFEGYGPLASFSAKIDIAFALGLLTRDMKSDLGIVRKVRNHFAHHPKHTSFADNLVRDLCANLTTAKGISTEDGGVFRQEQPKDQYLFAVVFSLTYFDRFIAAESRRKVPKWPLSK